MYHDARLLFLFASLSCNFFLSALSSTLVQLSASLLQYFNLTLRSDILLLLLLKTNQLEGADGPMISCYVAVQSCRGSEISAVPQAMPTWAILQGLKSEYLLWVEISFSSRSYFLIPWAFETELFLISVRTSLVHGAIHGPCGHVLNGRWHLRSRGFWPHSFLRVFGRK